MTRIFGAPLALAAAMMLASLDMAEARAVTDSSGPGPAAAVADTSPREDRADRMLADCRDDGGTHLERGECMMPE